MAIQSTHRKTLNLLFLSFLFLSSCGSKPVCEDESCREKEARDWFIGKKWHCTGQNGTKDWSCRQTARSVKSG